MNKLLIGFTTGLIVGLLFAPAKGSETRETISNRGRELKNKFNDLVDSVTDKFDSMQDDVNAGPSDDFGGTKAVAKKPEPKKDETADVPVREEVGDLDDLPF